MYNDFSSISSGSKNEFHDGAYLNAVVGYLKKSRIQQSVELSQLATSRHLNPSLLEHAERGNLIPNVRQLKAWAKALGLSWEQLWTEALPRNEMQRQTDHLCS